MRIREFILLIVVSVLVFAPAGAGEWEGKDWEEVPDWAATLGLFVFGGPAASAVQIRLNDRTVAEVAPGEFGKIYEILAALNTGANVLDVEFRASTAPPEERARLSVSLATSKIKEDGMRQLGEAIAETALPVDPPADSCTETFRFWAGPPPETKDELKKDYFMAVQGPPVGYLVTVRINDQPLYTTTQGERFFEVTTFLRKGQNRVTFDAVPACFPEGITASGKLMIVLAAGRMTPDGEFSWEGQLLGQFELENRKNPEPFTRRQNFRAR